MKQNLWLTLVTCLAHCVDKEFWKAIDYLKEQVQVRKEQREKDRRILLDDCQRISKGCWPCSLGAWKAHTGSLEQSMPISITRRR